MSPTHLCSTYTHGWGAVAEATKGGRGQGQEAWGGYGACQVPPSMAARWATFADPERPKQDAWGQSSNKDVWFLFLVFAFVCLHGLSDLWTVMSIFYLLIHQTCFGYKCVAAFCNMFLCFSFLLPLSITCKGLAKHFDRDLQRAERGRLQVHVNIDVLHRHRHHP